MVRRGESSPGAGIQSAIEVPVDIDRLVDNILGINVIPFRIGTALELISQKLSPIFNVHYYPIQNPSLRLG
jgi:hypothetical protein